MGQEYDCIFIPGGGLLPDGGLPAWTAARLDRALQLAGNTTWIALLSGGTVHKPPPLDSRGYPIHEAHQAAGYLIQSGIGARKLLTEISSYDTIGNAYFSRLLFGGPFTLERIHVITSAFHMPRTEAIFKWIYSLAPLENDYTLSFESVPDLGLSEKALMARREREAASLADLQEKIMAINTLELCHHWLYSEHGAYAIRRKRESLSEDELQSY